MLMQPYINLYAQWIARHPKQVLFLIGIISLLLFSQLPKLKINPTPYFLDINHDSRVAENRAKQTFTNTGETAFIALITDEPTVFNTETLTTVKALSDRFAHLSLVTPQDRSRLTELAVDESTTKLINELMAINLSIDSLYLIDQLIAHLQQTPDNESNIRWLNDLKTSIKPVERVRSLATYETLQHQIDDGESVLEVFPLMASIPQDNTELGKLRDIVMSNPIFVGLLVSENEQATSVQIELTIDPDDSPKMVRAYEAIDAVLKAQAMNESAHIGGPPMVTAQISKIIDSDNKKLMPFVFLVVGLVLYFCFGCRQGVFIPLTIATITTGWTVSTMALLGVPQNIVTTMLPVFIISIAVADAIHFLSAYYSFSHTTQKQSMSAQNSDVNNTDADSALHNTFFHLFNPLLVTTITTAVAFIIIAQTELVFLQEFGWFTAIGIGYAFFLTITLLPVMLSLQKESLPSGALESVLLTKLTQLIQQCAHYLNQHTLRSSMLLLIFCMIASVHITKLDIDNEVIGFFDEQERIRIDEAKIKQYFGGTTPFNIHLTAESAHRFKDPDVLKAMEMLTSELMAMETVGYTSSVVDFVKYSHQIILESAYALPDNADASLIGQLLFLFESATTQDIRNVTTTDYQQARLFVSLRSDQSSSIDEVIDRVLSVSKAHMPADIKISVSGFAELLATSTQEIVHDQVSHTSLAFLAIIIILSLLFRSIALAVIAVVPLFFTILLTFSLMSLTRIPLDIGTSIVTCISIGIGIDYAIHFLSFFKQATHQSQLPIIDAIKATLEHVSRPILINSFSLALGFLVLTVSDYAALVHLGYIIASAMILCAALTLFVLPLTLLLIARIK